jgi:hypothetical protein
MYKRAKSKMLEYYRPLQVDKTWAIIKTINSNFYRILYVSKKYSNFMAIEVFFIELQARSSKKS